MTTAVIVIVSIVAYVAAGAGTAYLVAKYEPKIDETTAVGVAVFWPVTLPIQIFLNAAVAGRKRGEP